VRYWKFTNPDSVQSCSNDKHMVPGAKEISKVEFNNFIASLPVPPTPAPVRDLLQELDALKAKMEAAGISV